jgi:hypothetical protein
MGINDYCPASCLQPEAASCMMVPLQHGMQGCFVEMIPHEILAVICPQL